jgi:DNA-binding MarR family transcriptional regulator
LHRNLIQLLSEAEWRVTRQLAGLLRTHGCSVEQWRVLLLLSDGQGHAMREVSEFALLPAPSLTRLVDRMVSDNLVHRRVDDADRRRVLVMLTARGEKLFGRLSLLVEERYVSLVEAAGDADAGQLEALLSRFVGVLECRPDDLTELAP